MRIINKLEDQRGQGETKLDQVLRWARKALGEGAGESGERKLGERRGVWEHCWRREGIQNRLTSISRRKRRSFGSILSFLPDHQIV